jgi:hypothetical protein
VPCFRAHLDTDQSCSLLRSMLGRVVATLGRNRRFDGLPVQHTASRARRAPGTLTVEHQRHVLDGLEHRAAHEAVKPSVDRLPMGKSLGSFCRPQILRAR